MAYKVPVSKLTELSNWLKTFLPDSSSVYGHAISNTRGLENDEFWTDSWPDITTVLVKVPRKLGKNEKLSDEDKNMAVFSTDATACRLLLEADEMVDWTGFFKFLACSLSAKNCIDEICREKRIQTLTMDRGDAHFADGDVTTIDTCSVKDGFTLEALREEDAPKVSSRWKFAIQGSDDLIVHCIKTYPSVGLRDCSGTLQGWALCNKDWSIGKLHVEPEFRRRGFATLIYNYIAKAILQEGVKPSSRFLSDNEVAFNFHTKIGYLSVRQTGLYRITRIA